MTLKSYHTGVFPKAVASPDGPQLQVRLKRRQAVTWEASAIVGPPAGAGRYGYAYHGAKWLVAAGVAAGAAPIAPHLLAYGAGSGALCLAGAAACGALRAWQGPARHAERLNYISYYYTTLFNLPAQVMSQITLWGGLVPLPRGIESVLVGIGVGLGWAPWLTMGLPRGAWSIAGVGFSAGVGALLAAPGNQTFTPVPSWVGTSAYTLCAALVCRPGWLWLGGASAPVALLGGVMAVGLTYTALAVATLGYQALEAFYAPTHEAEQLAVDDALVARARFDLAHEEHPTVFADLAMKKWVTTLKATRAPRADGVLVWRGLPMMVLAGPPGVGKTASAQALAQSLGARLLATTGGEMMATGDFDTPTAAFRFWTLIAQAHHLARKERRCVVLFIDEMAPMMPALSSGEDNASLGGLMSVFVNAFMQQSLATLNSPVTVLMADNHVDAHLHQWVQYTIRPPMRLNALEPARQQAVFRTQGATSLLQMATHFKRIPSLQAETNALSAMATSTADLTLTGRQIGQIIARGEVAVYSHAQDIVQSAQPHEDLLRFFCAGAAQKIATLHQENGPGCAPPQEAHFTLSDGKVGAAHMMTLFDDPHTLRVGQNLFAALYQKQADVDPRRAIRNLALIKNFKWSVQGLLVTSMRRGAQHARAAWVWENAKDHVGLAHRLPPSLRPALDTRHIFNDVALADISYMLALESRPSDYYQAALRAMQQPCEPDQTVVHPTAFLL